MTGTKLAATAVLLLLFWNTHQAHAQVPTVVITVTGRTDPPGFVPSGPFEFRAASGPQNFTCTATGGGGSGDYDYVWTSTCSRGCDFQTTSTGTTSVITRAALHSGDIGTHTCTASRGGESGSDSITLNVVDYGIHIFRGTSNSSSTVIAGSLPNNGLVIATPTGNLAGRFLRIFCRSDSMMDNVGDIIGLDGTAIGSGRFFIERPQPGEITMVNSATEGPLPSDEQGVYTCRIPDSTNTIQNINIGIYIAGFNIMPTITNPLVFTPGSSSSTLTCTSTGSVATTVTFMRDGVTVGPLRDGESMDFGGVTYQLAQAVTNRTQSTYQNVLTINQPLADIVGSSFTCSVGNTIGASSTSDSLQIIVTCDSNPCQNGGTCIDEGDGFMCDCTSGFTGVKCDIEVLCSNPVDIDNGTVTFTTTSVGDTATYSCDSDFELDGGATTTCSAVDANSAEFSPQPPVCRPLCSNPADIDNGMVTFTGNSIDDTATYSCNPGFELDGGATTTCTAVDENSAEFSPQPPVCRRTIGPPLNFMITVEGTTIFSFAWNPPVMQDSVNITDYVIRCEPQLEGIPTPHPVTQTASLPLTAMISGLAPGVDYSCSVAAISGAREGIPAQDTASTLEIAPTGAPQNFSIVPGDHGPTSREVTFFWDLPLPSQRNGIITDHTISCSPDTETLPVTIATLPGTEGLTVGDFQPFTEYSCTVIATNSQGSGPPAIDTTRTNEDVPGPVSNFLWNSLSDSRVVVSWGLPLRPNGIILEYTVILLHTGFADVQTVSSSTLMVEFTSPELEAGIPFSLTAFAVNTAGNGEPTTITSFTEELTPPAPSGVTVDRISDTQMTVSWTPLSLVEARSLIQLYRVFYSPEGSRRKRQSETTCFQSPCDVPGTESSVLIDGLVPASSYSVRVAAVNGQNQQGNFSETQTTRATVSSSDNIVAIVGGAVAVVALVVIGIIVMIVLVLRYWSKNRRAEYSPKGHEPFESIELSARARSETAKINIQENVAYSANVQHPRDSRPSSPVIVNLQAEGMVPQDGMYDYIPREHQPSAADSRPPAHDASYEIVNSCGSDKPLETTYDDISHVES